MTTAEVLDRVLSFQSRGDILTQPGVFRGQRFNPAWGGYEREENNIFFAFTVIHILKRIAPGLSVQEQVKIDQSISHVKALLPYYMNPFDGLSVNYWPRFPAGHFPNGKLYRHTERFKASDDIDDTGYAMAIWGPDLIDFDALTQKLIPFCQGVVRKNHKTDPVLSNLPAYNTWMGHHMAVDVDVCVLANFLPPLLATRKALNQYDEASLDFLVEVVGNRWYTGIPHLVCGYYFKVPVMVYHLARHLNLLPDPWATKIKDAILRDWDSLSAYIENPIHRLIMDSAAIYLGVKPAGLEPVITEHEVAQPYTCYYMGMLTALDYPIINQIADQPFFQVQKKCEAFNWALWLENQVLRSGYLPGPLWWSSL